MKKAIYSLINKIIEADFAGMASEMAFIFILGLFPFLLFLMAMFGWLGKQALMNPILHFLTDVAPADAGDLVMSVLNEVMIFQNGGIVALIGLVITIALASNAVAVIMKGLNRAYQIKENRPFWLTRLLSVLMVFANAFVLFISVNLIVFGKVILEVIMNFIHLPDLYINIILISRWPLSFVALYCMAFINYHILPAVEGHEKVRRKSAIKGTLFFCVLWLLGSWSFSLYLNNLNTYNKVYGTIGAFAILMIWLYYTSLIILIGGEINSQEYEKLISNNEE